MNDGDAKIIAGMVAGQLEQCTPVRIAKAVEDVSSGVMKLAGAVTTLTDKVSRQEALIKELLLTVASIGKATTKRMYFCGPHKAGTDYTRGAVVQRGGNTWVCTKDTAEEPGESECWRRFAVAK